MSIWIEAKQYIPKITKTVYPAQRACAHFVIENPKYRTWKVVHAFVNKSGKVKGYAFLVRGSKVIDVCGDCEIHDRDKFVKKQKIIVAWIYSYTEVIANMGAFRRYGRWEVF